MAEPRNVANLVAAVGVYAIGHHDQYGLSPFDPNERGCPPGEMYHNPDKEAQDLRMAITESLKVEYLPQNLAQAQPVHRRQSMPLPSNPNNSGRPAQNEADAVRITVYACTFPTVCSTVAHLTFDVNSVRKCALLHSCFHLTSTPLLPSLP